MRKFKFFFNGMYNIVKKQDDYVIQILKNEQYIEQKNESKILQGCKYMMIKIVILKK